MPKQPTPRQRRWGPFVVGLVAIGIAVAGVALYVILRHHKVTGEWKIPSAQSFVQIKTAPLHSREPSRVIYLHRGGIELHGGIDDANNNLSSIVALGSSESVVTAAFSGSNRQWNSIVKCTKKMFSPFAVTVTDALPATDDHILVAVGGKVDALKQKKHAHASGLAPFIPNQAIPGAVVFAFSAAVKNNPQTVCETIAMEVGHAYGLDHGFSCKDTMTYLKRCGSRSFTDKDVRCGEGKARDCAGGNPTQNSRKYLLQLLGKSAG